MLFKHSSAIAKTYMCFITVLITNPNHSTIHMKEINSIPAKLSTKEIFIMTSLNCHLTLGFMDHDWIEE